MVMPPIRTAYVCVYVLFMYVLMSLKPCRKYRITVKWGVPPQNPKENLFKLILIPLSCRVSPLALTGDGEPCAHKANGGRDNADYLAGDCRPLCAPCGRVPCFISSVWLSVGFCSLRVMRLACVTCANGGS